MTNAENTKSLRDGNTGPFLSTPTVDGVLDEYGLLPVSLLESPLLVSFPAWADVTTGEIYQLLWDDTPTGFASIIVDGSKPGDILTTELPASELKEGLHKLAYRVTNPENGLHSDSLHIPIIIDRTAPGSPQLAPIIFPDIIQEGLTSSELEGLENVLTVEIASYNGIARDDVIHTYWGELEGPITFVSVDDMGPNRIKIQFPRAFLEQAGDGEASVHYTVTDLAGNLSMPSEAVPVTLRLSVITPLPNPTLKEAVGGTLDPANTPIGVTVVIDASAHLKSGEKITINWKGPKASDNKEKVVTVAEAGKTLEVIFASVMVSANDGQTIELSYTVTRNSGIVQYSDTAPFRVLSAQLELPAPAMDTVGADGILRPSLIPESGATVRIRYPGMTAGDLVKVRWSGATVENTPLQTVDGEAQLTFTVSKAAIVASQGGAASLSYFVLRNGIERESEKLVLTVSVGLELDTSPVELNGKVYLFAKYPDLLPAFPSGTTVKRVPQGGQPPYTYTSSDPKIAHVDAEGLVSVRGKGGASITVTDASADSKSYQVSVTGVIECHNLGTGTWPQMSSKAAGVQGRLGTIQEVIEIYNAYKGRWPLQRGYWWSSTLAKTVFGAKWYYAKDMHTGVDYSYLHANLAQGLALR